MILLVTPIAAMYVRRALMVSSLEDYRLALLSEIVPLQEISQADLQMYRSIDDAWSDFSGEKLSSRDRTFEQLRYLVDCAVSQAAIGDDFLHVLVHLADADEDIGVTVLQLLVLSDQEWSVLKLYYQLSVAHDLVGIQRLCATPLMLGLSDTCWAVLLKIIISQHDEISLSYVIEYGAISHFTLLRSCAMAYKTNQLNIARQLLEVSLHLPLKPLSTGTRFVVDVHWLQKEQQELVRALGLSV